MGKTEEESYFRGLLYEPSLEQEVLILFSLLIPYLEDKFVIESYPDTFPDCLAERNGKKIQIEFETLASSFWMHENDDNLNKCDLLVCWRNNKPGKLKLKNGKEILTIRGHEIEVMALKQVYEDLLLKEKCPKLIYGERPPRSGASKERFFEQLSVNVSSSIYNLIENLYAFVEEKKDEFEIKFGGKKRTYTARFFVKKWNIDPINVSSNGSVSICYQANPAQSTWALPKDAQNRIRQLLNHNNLNKKGLLPKWPGIPLENEIDLDKIKEALRILVDSSNHDDIM